MFLKLSLLALPVLVILDLLWLGLIAKNFYSAQIGGLLKPDVNWMAVIVFYLIFITGLVVFVISPAVEKGSWTHALMFGALFGLVCYATYDLTNLAVAKDWPILVTIVDMAWGAVIASLVSLSTYFLAMKFFV
ncbi:DUF2177 family protein [Patescibacteria group bacterium]|nr:MAG: DUF2177 family protein [Patescibacteria group bacterium]